MTTEQFAQQYITQNAQATTAVAGLGTALLSGVGHVFDVVTGEAADKRQADLMNNQLKLQEDRFAREDRLAEEREKREQSREDRLTELTFADKREERLARAEERRYQQEQQDKKDAADREERRQLIEAGKAREAQEMARKSAELAAADQKDREKLNAQIAIAANAAAVERIRNQRAPRRDAGQSAREAERVARSKPFTIEQSNGNRFKQSEVAQTVLDIGSTLAGLYIGKRFFGGGLPKGGLKAGISAGASGISNEEVAGHIAASALQSQIRQRQAQKAVQYQSDVAAYNTAVPESTLQRVRPIDRYQQGLSEQQVRRTLVI